MNETIKIQERIINTLELTIEAQAKTIEALESIIKIKTMTLLEPDFTLHQTHFFNPNCEYCEPRFEILQNWYLKHWISYKEYLRLTQLPF